MTDSKSRTVVIKGKGSILMSEFTKDLARKLSSSLPFHNHLRRRTKRRGVVSVVTNIANSQVIVLVFVDAKKLVKNVHWKTKKQTSIVPEKKEGRGGGRTRDEGRKCEEEKKPKANEEEYLNNEMSKYEY
ncbi:hypothetical protein Cni_G25303 [Canna indica]|uniref:Uncharacterized protein n=1 Tax=Canna indica TaxID=4628 RepID=A0AAQ3QPB7_9LILI|nr:hypothetical protein Cni_G25303 [Canna indica]